VTSKMRNMISDTSCIIVLDKLELLYILKEIYGTVLVTKEVANEYGSNLPDWIYVKEVQDRKTLKLISAFVDLGEASSLALALETENSTVIMDDLKGRSIAEKLSVKITGTLGVLVKAKDREIIYSLMDVVEQLKAKGFRISKELEKELLKYD